MNSTMPEAKSSVSYSLLSSKGYPLIFTVRSHDEAELLEVMESLEATFVKEGYQPDRRNQFQAKPAPVPTGEKCPKCGADLVKFASKDGTKSGVKCSTQKFDWVNKVTLGCDYTKWDDNGAGGVEASEAQKALLEAKGLWKDGMTKSEASKVIGDLLSK